MEELTIEEKKERIYQLLDEQQDEKVLDLILQKIKAHIANKQDK